MGGESPISAAEVAAAQQFGQSLSIAEWLGPMAPVALSPFFGITCLSALAMFGGDWIARGNPLLGENSPLHNPAVFWTFLTLTILTSLPRLTKVSKPFAQAVDQLEAWSGIVTMLVMKFMLTEAGSDAEPAVVQAGLVEFSSETLLMLAAVINIFVINAVKFFFEVLIWLTPIPMLDALFEFCNKALCAALMALYAWSPTIATGLNLAMFAVALCVFGWMHRREIFFRHMLFGMLRTWFGSGAHQLPLLVFPTAAVGSIPARARCRLSKSSSGWTLTFQPLLKARRVVELPAANTPQMESGFLTNSIRFPSPAVELTFAKCSSESLSVLANQLQATISGQPSPSRTNATARVRLAFNKRTFVRHRVYPGGNRPLHYSNFPVQVVVHKPVNHRDKPGGGICLWVILRSA